MDKKTNQTKLFITWLFSICFVKYKYVHLIRLLNIFEMKRSQLMSTHTGFYKWHMHTLFCLKRREPNRLRASGLCVCQAMPFWQFVVVGFVILDCVSFFNDVAGWPGKRGGMPSDRLLGAGRSHPNQARLYSVLCSGGQREFTELHGIAANRV